MTLYKSHYLFVNYLETRYLTHLKWTVPADLLDEVGYYAEMAKFFNERVKRPGRLILWDFTVIENRVNEKFFAWIDDYILPKILSIKATKIAYIITNEALLDKIPLGNISFGEKNVERRIFSDQAQAMQWLIEDGNRVIRGPEKHHHH